MTARSVEQARQAADTLGYPVVIAPDFGGYPRFVVNDPGGLKDAVARALVASPTGSVNVTREDS